MFKCFRELSLVGCCRLRHPIDLLIRSCEFRWTDVACIRNKRWRYPFYIWKCAHVTNVSFHIPFAFIYFMSITYLLQFCNFFWSLFWKELRSNQARRCLNGLKKDTRLNWSCPRIYSARDLQLQRRREPWTYLVATFNWEELKCWHQCPPMSRSHEHMATLSLRKRRGAFFTSGDGGSNDAFIYGFFLKGMKMIHPP